MRHLKRFNENNMEMNVQGLKCDNPECNWNDMSISFDEYPNYVDSPCPECGENILKNDEYQQLLQMKQAVDKLNQMSEDDIQNMMQNLSPEQMDAALDQMNDLKRNFNLEKTDNEDGTETWSSKDNINESSSFIILLAAWFLYDSLSKIPKKQWPQHMMENTKEMFTDFVSFLSKYGYPVDIEVLKGKIDNIFRLALGKLYKEGGIVDYEKGELNESLPRERSVNQLKKLRSLTRGTDIGDRIPDLMKQGANIHYSGNVVDRGIESYEDYERHNKKFVPSWNLKHLMSPFSGESKKKKKKKQ